ncbi:MAG: excinuclease ABC subunit UvrC [Oscillospiraceae bacterium]|nr:excinuclease ABC subunit UvrC [Oscillospiraceae bacterium]
MSSGFSAIVNISIPALLKIVVDKAADLWYTDKVMKLEELRQAAHELPLKPGVYFMKDKTGDIIYVGKAKLLRNRVSSYFRESGHDDPKTRTLVSRIDRFDIVVCSSEFEALVTENTFIKQHKPRYNILLKDSKGYPYARLDLSSAKYPRFEVVGKPQDDGALYLGPYYSRHTLFDAITVVNQVLRLPLCSSFGKKVCLNYHIKLCDGWCTGTPGIDEYKARMKQAVAILDGHSEEVSREIENEMFDAAENLRFERAAQLRDRLRALGTLAKKQLPAPGMKADTDAFAFYRGEAKSAFAVLCYSAQNASGGAKLLGKDYDVFPPPQEEDGEALSHLLREYYIQRGVCPKTILIPFELPDANEIAQLFREAFGHGVEFIVPQRGDKLELIRLARDNAYEEVLRATTTVERANKTLEWLRDNLKLDAVPNRIEAFDISHTAGSEVVGGMVVFKNAKPLKRDYRRFKIKTVEGNDDYHSMREVLQRRLAHLDAESADTEKWEKPDLILLDGGGTLANMARELTDIPVFGMVKDNRHRTRALVSPDNAEIGIAARPDVFGFIGKLQEETHRYAVEYHRLLRSKTLEKSELDAIPGIGKVRREALFKHFKSLKAIEAAAIEELQSVVPKSAAEIVWKHFHSS